MYPNWSINDPGDRFIPRRIDQDINLSNFYVKETTIFSPNPQIRNSSTPKYVNFACTNWKSHIYREKLWSTLSPASSKVLNFSQTTRKPKIDTDRYKNHNDWPVYPRKSPLIGCPLMVLDMPEFDSSICYNMTDWGKKGFIASIFDEEVYLWHPERKVSYIMPDFYRKAKNSIKFNRKSTYIACATNVQTICVWDCHTNKIQQEMLCPCFGTAMCEVTCFEWSSKDWLIAGCSNGRMSVFNSDFVLVWTSEKAHVRAIITLSLSCAETYLASSCMRGFVRVWYWPIMKENFQIRHSTPVRGIAWHPWKNSLLMAGGGVMDGSLSLWKVSNHKLVDAVAAPYQDFAVDALNWNPLSGELVVSFWKNTNFSSVNSIVVMSDLYTVLDAIEWHNGRVMYLLWGNKGTQLATVGSDENLCIWDFFGKSDMKTNFLKKLKNRKKFSTNPFHNLNRFGATIR